MDKNYSLWQQILVLGIAFLIAGYFFTKGRRQYLMLQGVKESKERET